MLAETVSAREKQAQLIALHAMRQAHLRSSPESWGVALAAAAQNRDPAFVREAVLTARNVAFDQRPAPMSEALLHIAHDSSLPEDERLDAIAGAKKSIHLDQPLFDFLCAQLDQSKPVSSRVTAASALERAKLTAEQQLKLAANLKNVGPLEITHLIGAYENATDAQLGEAVLAALKDSKGRSSLRKEIVKPKLAKFPADFQQKLDEFLASLNVDSAKQSAHINELLTQIKGGNIYRGQSIFNSAKAGCSSCHSIGYGGGHVGPDLTRIGQVRTERDLLEAIVYPSASFVRSYEPYIVSTKDGEDYSGVIKKDAPDEVILATGPQSEQRIPRANIADMRMGSVSVMPQGLDQQLTKQELADLVAFLKSSVGGTH
jgi:putative heme-binding domain-containing protein